MNRSGAAEVEAVVDDVAPAPSTIGYRRLWQFAWPVATSTSTVTLLTLVNLFWIGHLGTVAVAAVSVCGNILFIVFGLSNIVHTGALAIVSRRVGAGSIGAAHAAVRHAVLLGGVLGIVVALLGWIAAPPTVGFFGVGTEVETLATSYLRTMYIAQVPLFLSVALSACYQAGGDTRTPMLINMGVVLANGVADPFFIFKPGQVQLAGVDIGWLGWGVDGAAIAAVLTGALGCIGFLTYSALRQRPFPTPSGGAEPINPDLLWHMLRIGTPASISMVARPLSTFLLLKVIASFGTAAIAAFGIAMRSFGVSWIPYSGISVAVSALVGQSLGAHRVRDAERVVHRGVIVSTALGVFFCLLYHSTASDIIRAFDHEPDVVAAGTSFLQMIALGWLFSGPMLPLGSAMNGAGDTKPPMIAAFLANWAVKLPLCYALALPFGWGINGVWMGMFISIAFESLVMFVWYGRGTWKTKRV